MSKPWWNACLNDEQLGGHSEPSQAVTPTDDPMAELCVKCGFTYYNHESNTGVPYPCWTPSGRYSTDKRKNNPFPVPPASPLPEEPPAELPKEIESALRDVAFNADQLDADGLRHIPQYRASLASLRAALVALFDRQREEIKALQTMIDALQTSHRADVASLSSQLERLTGERSLIGELYVEVTSALQECCQKYKLGLGGEQCHALVIAELERLKAEQITRAEALAVLADPEGSDSPLYLAWCSAIEKIRRLSQSDTGDTE